MTEIPEHLLKRSKERRAAMGLPGGEGDAEASAPSETAPTPAAEKAPVAAKAATPAVAPPPPPPKPVPAFVAAAQSRRRIPYWAMPIVALLPVWGILYFNSVSVPPVEDDALIHGETVYATCSSCHGGGGEGGVGAKLNGGDVLLTWPDPKAMMEWIYIGGEEWTKVAGSNDYGDPDRPGGPHNTDTLAGPMPGQESLSADDLMSVTRYIREELSGAPDESEVITEELAEEAIESAEAGELIYANEDPDPERVEASTPPAG